MFKLLIAVYALVSFAAFKPKTISDVTVTSAGTRKQISATALYVPSVCVQAKPGNTGVIYFGGSSVSSTSGVSIAAGASICLNSDVNPGHDVVNLANIYIDAAQSNDGVKVVYTVVE